MQITEEENTDSYYTNFTWGHLTVCICRRHSLHALSSLSGNVNQLDHLELGLDDVQVVIQAGTFTPLGHNGQLRLGGVAHEEQDVYMTRFPGGKYQTLTKLHLLDIIQYNIIMTEHNFNL